MAARKMEQIAFAELQRLRHSETDCRKLRADLDRCHDRLERAKVTIEALQTEIMRRPLRIPRFDEDIPF
ncbi:MAG: hypothetical protein B7Z40_12175 [Bosea sp. 12-68-7]|nr:MAG: hypothetical protein B7Z40_12175 [Bosea sp. 12-68-7]OYW97486.1 MAG: hypothetical protein B7Z14_17565 [Bosea sp. 32-68-6]